MRLAGLCKGSTADSDSVCEGSNPSPAAKKQFVYGRAAFVLPVMWGTVNFPLHLTYNSVYCKYAVGWGFCLLLGRFPAISGRFTKGFLLTHN